MGGRNFTELSWPGASLLAIDIDRAQPGGADTIDVHVQWPSGARALVRFRDCFEISAALRFRDRAPDTIASADVDDASPLLGTVRARLAATGADIVDLYCFRLVTTTGGIVEIIARGFLA